MNEISRKPAHTVAELGVMMMMNKSNPGSVPVARPRQRRNKSAGHSLECRGRGLGGVLRKMFGIVVGCGARPESAVCTWAFLRRPMYDDDE